MLRSLLDTLGKPFSKGEKFEKLYPLYEAGDTFFYTPGETTKGPSHVRDALDLKRMMSIVVLALVPCIFMAMYNTGWQANSAIARAGIEAADVAGWRAQLVRLFGFGFDPTDMVGCCFHGLMWYLPVVIVTLVVGGHLEALFAVVRKHEINEGFLVTSALFPLVLPPTIPLWQVALGIAFGVVIGKEVFGGTGMNILNPALTARAFLFFAYPAQITGDEVWVGSTLAGADGYSCPTILSANAAGGPIGEGGLATLAARPEFGSTDLTGMWWDAFYGFIPGSMGETSALACLIGAVLLILMGVASWRIMFGCLIGTMGMASLLVAIGSETNAGFALPWHWHLVIGGWAFGVVFMATEPVSAPFAEAAKFWYGVFIGVLIVLIRVVNPAYPEGVMLAILLMNCFSATFDHVVMSANIKRRKERTKPLEAGA